MTVLRIDFLSPIGRQVAGQYSVDFIPTLLLFDGDGRLVTRQQGFIDAGEIRDAVVRITEDAP